MKHLPPPPADKEERTFFLPPAPFAFQLPDPEADLLSCKSLAQAMELRELNGGAIYQRGNIRRHTPAFGLWTADEWMVVDFA